MSASTTPPGRRGRTPGVTKGYRRLPSGKFQIRLAGFPQEIVASELAAQLRVAELRVAREQGLALAAPSGARFATLGEAAESFLAHKLAHGGRNGPLGEGGVKYWKQATKPWREGPLAKAPLRTLSREALQKPIDERTLTHRVAAINEAEALLAILARAQKNDVVFPASLLGVEVPRRTPRTRPDLTPADFDFLVAFVDERQQRLFELAATLGCRINELFALERSWVDLAARRIVIPLAATKEKREKLLELTNEETELLRAQLLDVYARLGSDTRYVFPMMGGGHWRGGGRWRYGDFHERVWTPAKRDAMTAWYRLNGELDPAGVVARYFELRKELSAWTSPKGQAKLRSRAEVERDLAALPQSPYNQVTLHALRRTCVGWLRASNLPVEIIAQRLGHNDGGATLLRRYRYVRPGEARAALDGLGEGVRARLRELEQPGDDEDGE